MNNDDKVLSLLSMDHWLSMREILSLFPKANRNTIRVTVYTLHKKTFMKIRALRGKNGGLVCNSYQYSIFLEKRVGKKEGNTNLHFIYTKNDEKKRVEEPLKSKKTVGETLLPKERVGSVGSVGNSRVKGNTHTYLIDH